MKNPNFIFLLLLIFCCHLAKAQMDSCNIFFGGKYVQAGMAYNGSFGTSIANPPGYYGNVSNPSSSCYCTSGYYYSNQLGFIADPDMDGWTVGTPPFWGDFFLPGSPFEGWAMEWDSFQCSGWQTDISCG